MEVLKPFETFMLDITRQELQQSHLDHVEYAQSRKCSHHPMCVAGHQTDFELLCQRKR